MFKYNAIIPQATTIFAAHHAGSLTETKGGQQLVATGGGGKSVVSGTVRRVTLTTAMLVALAIAGCAYSLWKPGATEQLFKKDSYECEVEARVAGRSLTWPGMPELWRRCMEAQGYSGTPEGERGFRTLWY